MNKNQILINEVNAIISNFISIYKGIVVSKTKDSMSKDKRRALHFALVEKVQVPLEKLKDNNSDKIHFINAIISKTNGVKTLGKDDLEILSKYVRDAYVDERLLEDLKKRIQENRLNEDNIVSAITALLEGGLEGEIEDMELLEDFIRRASVESSMEILNWLYNYARSGDAERDQYSSIEDIFEKINKRSLSPNKVFEKRGGKFVYHMAESGIIDSVYVSDNGKIYSSDTTYSKKILIENDSFIRHATDIYIVQEMFQEKLLEKGLPTNDTIEETTREMRNTVLDLEREREIFRDKNEDWVSLIGQTTYSIVHNSRRDLEEERVLFLGYASRIKEAYSDNYMISTQEVEEFLKNLDMKMVGSQKTLNLRDPIINEMLSSNHNAEAYLSWFIEFKIKDKIHARANRKNNFINFIGLVEYLLQSKRIKKEDFRTMLLQAPYKSSYLEMLMEAKYMLKKNVGEEAAYINTFFTRVRDMGLEDYMDSVEKKINMREKQKRLSKSNNSSNNRN